MDFRFWIFAVLSIWTWYFYGVWWNFQYQETGSLSCEEKQWHTWVDWNNIISYEDVIMQSVIFSLFCLPTQNRGESRHDSKKNSYAILMLITSNKNKKRYHNGNTNRVVPALDDKIYLVAITITHDRDSIFGTCIVVKNTFLNKLKYINMISRKWCSYWYV